MDNILGIDVTGANYSPNYGGYQSRLQTDAMRENLEEGIGLPSLVATITKTYSPGIKAIKNLASSISEKLGEDIPQKSTQLLTNQSSIFKNQPVSNKITDLPEFSNKPAESFEMRNFATDSEVAEPLESTVGNLEGITGAFTRLTNEIPSISDISKIVKPLLSGGGVEEGAEIAADAGTSLLEAASGVGLVGAVAGLGGLLESLFKPGPKAPTIPNIVSLPQFHF